MKRNIQYISIMMILVLIAALSIYLFSNDKFSSHESGYELLQEQLKEKKDMISTDVVVKNNSSSKEEENQTQPDSGEMIHQKEVVQSEPQSNLEEEKNTSEDFILEIAE